MTRSRTGPVIVSVITVAAAGAFVWIWLWSGAVPHEAARPARADPVVIRNDTLFALHGGELQFLSPVWTLPSRAGRCRCAPASTRAEGASSTSPARPPSAGVVR